jgi:hypothetical protein
MSVLSSPSKALRAALAAGFLFCIVNSPASAEDDPQNSLSTLEKRLDAQDKVIREQQRALRKQAEEIRVIQEQAHAPIDVDAWVNAAANANMRSRGLADNAAAPLPAAPVVVPTSPDVRVSAVPEEPKHKSRRQSKVASETPVVAPVVAAAAVPAPTQAASPATTQAAAAPASAPQVEPSGAGDKSEALSRAITTTPPPVETEDTMHPQVQALADEGGILSPRGMLTYENTLEYTNTTRNLFSFNGVELAQVVLVGAVNANNARHEVVQDTQRFRLGLTNRLEADVRVPFVYRNDAITNTTATTGLTTQTSEQGYNVGDIDTGLAYQLNDGKEGWPFLIGNLRYKANNADGPYDVPYDSNGLATRLPVGTGFNTVEASVTAIKVSDPAVLFGNLGYVYDMSRNVNRDINTTYIGRVEPGDAINALVGIAFAINPDTSFSLGYKHSYVFSTIQHSTDIATGTPTNTSTGSQQVGALTLGLSYAFTPQTSVNFNVEAGVTNDAPDVHLLIRVPFQLGKVF